MSLTDPQMKALHLITSVKYRLVGCPKYLIHGNVVKALINKGIIFRKCHRLFMKKNPRMQFNIGRLK